VIHIVRGGERTLPIAPDDWVVYLHPLRLTAGGLAGMEPGPITHDQLVALLVAADLVVTW
jgi:hypothetical protein